MRTPLLVAMLGCSSPELHDRRRVIVEAGRGQVELLPAQEQSEIASKP